MANSQIMVNMKFQADTTQAKAKMQELQNSLAAIGQVSNQSLPMNQLSMGLDKAKVAAAQLQVQLKSAFNQNTGKLDLSRFIQQMNQSGMSLEKYKASLMQAGPAGQKAFAQLATSVASADTHVIRISERMQKLGQTFANTIRWQISSAALMAITSTLSEAYRFAQDLNESLNDIRIVTGYSADYMKDFAEEANKAAKALSTTTTEYTKASLIYFQQGLNNKQVKERTDLTIKMANVTGQSVSEVSDQLTAVWNNFDNGTKSLDHYVDVMVALGAATASSSEEISEGLNKFAAVAETVGLSYEYAASALATVTATTRQSADVVGTAFKTLFARIQDLELGKTLEDGTSLGQYSQALANVGINIKDVNGDVKNMNTILDEMGEKWNTLSKDSQIALAQNVAGVRQYTQLIALMDNWDFFKENLNTSLNSSGALQEQADIYAESWRAARDKVTASLEDIYKTLLDDKVFINILKFFADFIENINGVIDSVGGLRGVILLLTTALMNMSKIGVANWMTSMSTSMIAMTKTGREYLSAQRDKALTLTTSMYDTNTDTGRLQNDALKNQVQLERDFYDLSKNMNEQEKATLQILKDQLATEQKNTEEKIQQFEIAQQQLATEKFRATKSYGVDSAQLTEVAQKAGQNQSVQRLFDSVSMTSEVNATNLSGYFKGDLSDESLNKASSATTNIIQQMEALKFGVDGADAELIEMFGEDGYNRLNTYYEKVKALATEINAIKEKPIADREKTQEDNKTAAKEEASRQVRMKELEENAPRSKDGTKLLGKEYSDLSKKSKEYNVNLQRNARTSIEAVTASQDLENALQNQNNEIGNTVGELVNATNGNEKAAAAIHKTVKAARDGADAHYESALATGQDAEALRKFNKQARDITAPIGMAQRITTMASAAMSAAMAMQALNSVVNIWKDEDASFGDKILQTMMSLGMVIPMLTSSFSRLNIAKMFGLALDETGIAFTPKKVAADGAETTATWLQTAAQNALNGSIFVSLGYFSLLLVAIAAVIGIIYLIVKALSSQETALEKAKKAQENYNQALTEANEALAEANQHLEDMKTLLDEITDIQNAFDNLVKGSTKWQENLEKNNEKILELLELYPELENITVNGQKLIDFKDGIYQITNQDALAQYVEGNATIRANVAQLAQAQAQKDKNMSDAEIDYFTAVQNNKNQIISSKIAYGKDGKSENYNSGDSGTMFKIGSKELYIQTQEEWNSPTAGYVNFKPIDGKENDVRNFTTTLTTVYGYLNDGKTIDEAISQANEDYKNSFMLPEEYTKFLKEGLNSIEDLTNAEKKLKEIRESGLPSIRGISQSILSARKGFSSLSSNDQQLSTMIYEQKLNNGMTNGIFSNAAEKEKLSENDADELAKIILNKDQSSESSATSWEDYFSSTEGKQVLNAYAKETYGEKIDFQDSEGFEATEFTNDERTIEYQAVLNWANAKNVIETEDVQELFQQVESYSDELVAAVTDNILTLTEAEVEALRVGIESGGQYTGQLESLADELNVTVDQLTSHLSEQIKSYSAELAANLRLQKDLQAGNAYIAESAEKFGLEAEVLETYASVLADSYGSYEKAAKATVMNAKYTKGIEKLEKALNDSTYALRQWKNTGELTYETAESLTEIISSLEDVFGVKVSTQFISDNLDQIQKLVEGGQQAINVMKELELLAAKDYVASLTLTEESEQALNSILEELTDLENNGFTIGADFELNQDYVTKLNEMIATGQASAEQIQKAFEAIGWSPNFTVEKIPQTSESYTFTQTTEEGDENTSAPNELGGWKGGQWQKVKTTTMTSVLGLGEAPTVTYSGRSNATISTASSGGSSSKKQKKSNEIERYKEINEEISDIERNLNKISKAKDRAFGKSKSDLIQQEINQQVKYISAQEEYLRQIREKFDEDWRNLDSRFTLDANGRIENYTSLLEELAKQVDNGTLTEEQYNEIKAGADQYIETLNLLEEQQEKVNDETQKMKDMSLEKIQYDVEYKIHFNDREIKYLEFLLKRLDDPFYDAAKSIATIGDIADENISKANNYMEGLRNIMGDGFSNEQYSAFEQLINNMPSKEDLPEAIKNIFGDTPISDDQREAIEGFIDDLYTTADSLSETYPRIMEKISAAFDDINEDAERLISNNERMGETLSHYNNIIDLTGRKALSVSYEQMRVLGQARVEQAKSNLALKKDQLEFNRSALDRAQKQLKAANASGDEDLIKHWEDQVNTMQDSVWQLESEVESAFENTLTMIAEEFENAVKDATSAFEEAMAGSWGTYENIQEMFNQQKEIADRYVDDYKKIYELSKLNRNINQQINKIDSVAGKQKLYDLQKEITDLQESGKEMSEYDLEYLQKKYDLRVAQIALEEAQAAKSQVRMRRDSEGNWSYVYTADENKVDEAQQNLEDKLYEIQEFTQNYTEELQDKIIQAEIDMIEAINSLRREDFATQEEYQAAVTRITEYYTGLRNYYYDELDKSLDNSKTIYETDWKDYSEKTGYKISLEEDWCDTYEETRDSMIRGYASIEQSRAAFEQATTEMVPKLTGAFGTWLSSTQDAFSKVGLEFNTFSQELPGKIDAVKNELNEIDTKFGEWKTAAHNGFQDIINEAAAIIEPLKNKLKPTLDNINSVISAFNELLSYSGKEVKAPKVVDDNNNPAGPNTGGKVVTSNEFQNPAGGNTSNYNNYGYDTKLIRAVQRFLGVDDDGKFGPVSQAAADKYTGYTEKLSVQEIIRHLVMTGKLWQKEYSDLFPVPGQFDTGGYTGEWDSSGRLAVLHQKEIVLNAHDTENFLAAVSIVRDIVSKIDLQAAAQQSSMGMISAATIEPTSQTLQQDVTIHAEFPNATNHSEIEEAFTTLFNHASQFANRKN